MSVQAVVYHMVSKTLLVTDAVVYISPDPPEVMAQTTLELHHIATSSELRITHLMWIT